MELLQQRWSQRASADTERIRGQPLVSIICFCKDRAATIRRSIDSVLSQSYANLEFVVQDGASTDGTLEILRGYDDPRVKIVSEQDSGPAEAFWKVINRCQGDIIGTCLSDEELLPGAVQRAVELFRSEPHLGAITCDGFVTDPDGKIINEFNAGEFNFVDYLFGWYCPFWPGSFFRRQALLEIGLKHHSWTIECLEFETWCRLAAQHEVKSVPVRMSKYAVHPTQLSNTRQYFHEHFDNRASVIRRLFSDEGFFGRNDTLLTGCLYNQLYLLYNHVRAYKLADQVELLARRLRELRESIGFSERIRFLEYFDFVRDDVAGSGTANLAALHVFRRVQGLWIRVALAIPASVRQRIPRRVKNGLRSALTVAMFLAFNAKFALSYVRRLGRQSLQRLKHQEVFPQPGFSPRVYHEFAQVYYGRGQIDQALQLWARAETGGDPLIDGLACQAKLMSPTATYEQLLSAQKRWADRHARPVASLGDWKWRGYDGNRRIRVGYYCAFLDSDVMRFLMMQVINQADKDRFEVFGYSPSPVSSDIAAGFDRFRVTGVLPDEKFVSTVRGDGIDIFVEVSGFSPQHRFAAMASRCAPVQISYLNHTGTSAVPNVDYVLADAISVHPDEDRFFTEKVWRLPGSFLCYNYDCVDLPDVAEPPSKKNGFVTFGCFGSGGKINLQLIELWAEILKRVPNSVFFIRNQQLSPPDNRHYMQDRFRRYGIAPERLRILGGTDRETIVRSYAEVDISLDTWPYCGGNTIAESIWQGVPVVTLKGDRFSSRYGASLLVASGCPELVGETADQYVDISVRLAEAPERLNYYRQNLRRLAREHGLTDAGGFARKLEAAYIEMLKRAPA